MIYERVMLEPLAFIFSVCSCSSLSHPTQQFCLGWQLFIELRQLFPIGSLIQAAMCLQVEPEHSLPQIPMPGEIRPCFGNMNLDKSLRIVELVFLCLSCVTTPEKNFRYWVGWHCFFFLIYRHLTTKFTALRLNWICVTVSEDKMHRGKSTSHFSEARKRGHTMLYQLTSQFSSGGKGEVNLGGVSIPLSLIFDWMWWGFFSIFPCMSSKKISRSCLDMQHLHTWA